MQETVSAAARWVARLVEPELRRRLRATYGQGWLEKVNQRRRAEGRAPGRSLRDHRFCLAVFAYDPATEGWADEELRRHARRLIGLANSAAHDDVTDKDVSRVREIVAIFSKHFDVSPPSKFVPGGTSPPGRRDVDEPDREGAGARSGGRSALPLQRLLEQMSGIRRGRWSGLRLPDYAKRVGTGIVAVVAITSAGALVHVHGVAALLALPFIVVLAVALAVLALYLLLWTVAVGGLAWAAYLFAQGENLAAVLYLWLSVIAGAVLFWLHEEVI